MALRTCLRRAAHQLSSRSLLASAATQSRGLTAAVAGGDDNGGEYFHIWKSSRHLVLVKTHIWKSSEGQYAAQLASGRWAHIPIKMARNHDIIEIGAEVIEDTKPAGFDERINIPEDYWEYDLPEAAQAFMDAATSNLVSAKWCMDGATSIEEAAQMLEAYAAYVRGLSKDGWYAGDTCDGDYFNLCRDLIAKEEGEKPGRVFFDEHGEKQVFVEEDPPDQLSTGEEGPAAADHCHIWKSSEGQYTAELPSGKWIRRSVCLDSTYRLVLEDTKPAGFDECIQVTLFGRNRRPLDEIDEQCIEDTMVDFIHAATSNFVRAKGCMDGATSIEQAAQMLEAHAAYVRGLPKNGWYAGGPCHDDWFHLCRDLKYY